MYDRIVVAVDESDGEGGLVLGRALARRLGAALTLLHVHHTLEAPAELEGLPQYRYQHVVETWDGLDSEEEAHEVEWLARKAAEVATAEPGVVVTSRVVHVSLARALQTPGERVMVVAAAAAGGPGPAAQEIIRAGGVPVLLIHPDGDGSATAIDHVLIALDGSRFSEEIVGPALDLAVALEARVSLVEIVPSYHGISRLLHAGARSPEAAEAFLRDVRQRMGPQRDAVDLRVVEAGSPAAALVGEARRQEGTMLAMATHGRGGFRRMLLGSVAERVIRESARPVLVLRPTGATAPQPTAV